MLWLINELAWLMCIWLILQNSIGCLYASIAIVKRNNLNAISHGIRKQQTPRNESNKEVPRALHTKTQPFWETLKKTYINQQYIVFV